jgi:hypothetical protein
MHKIFSLVEIIRLIADTIPFGQLKSAAALARCCKSISTPALDSLWGRQTDLGTLLAFSLPPSTWKIVNGVFVGSPSHRVAVYLNCLRRPRILSWSPPRSSGTAFPSTLGGCAASPSPAHSSPVQMRSKSSTQDSPQSPCCRSSGPYIGSSSQACTCNHASHCSSPLISLISDYNSQTTLPNVVFLSCKPSSKPLVLWNRSR